MEPEEHPRTTVKRELKEELGITLNGPVAAPLMVTCTQTVGVTSGHVDVSLWYAVQADRTKGWPSTRASSMACSGSSLMPSRLVAVIRTFYASSKR